MAHIIVSTSALCLLWDSIARLPVGFPHQLIGTHDHNYKITNLESC